MINRIGGVYMLRSNLTAQLEAKTMQLHEKQKDYERIQKLICNMLDQSNKLCAQIDDIADDIADLKDQIGGLDQ